MSDDDEPSLHALFGAELREHGGALLRGLASPPATSAGWRELSRRAHSLAGAARIMSLAFVERFARALEHALDSAERGTPLVGPRLRAATVVTEMLVSLESLTERELVEVSAQMLGAFETDLAVLTGGAPSPSSPALAPPPSSAPPPASPPPAEPVLVDAELADLFRVEVEGHGAVLARTLLLLEVHPDDVAALDEAMRAAHSIKGAARVVGLSPAVELAHLMEDALSQGKRRRHLGDATLVDALLAAGDALLAASREPTLDPQAMERSHGERMRALGQSIRAAVATPVAAAAPPSRVAPVAAAPAVAPGPAPAAARPVRTERVVRVSAARVDGMLGMAGEAVVEVGHLEDAVGRLRALARAPGEPLEAVWSLLTSGAEPAAVVAGVERALHRARSGRDALLGCIDALDERRRRVDELAGRLYRETVGARMRPFADAVAAFPRLVRDLCRGLGKRANVVVVGEETGVDREVLERLDVALNHLVRNAVDHGLEGAAEREAAGKPATATLRIEARHFAGKLAVTVSDDGRGVDGNAVRNKLVAEGVLTAAQAAALEESEVLMHLFAPGFSTAASVTELSGRGVGLDAVRHAVHEMSGSVRITSVRGAGTTFHLQLPITLSVLRGLVVTIAGEPYALPLGRLERVLRVDPASVHSLEGRPFVEVDGRTVSLVQAHELLDLPEGPPPTGALVVAVVNEGTRWIGLCCDALLGESDLVVRPLDARFGKIPGVSAATVLADGKPALILEPDELLRALGRKLGAGQLGRAVRAATAPARRRKRVLVVDDSITVREVERQFLAGRGYDVVTAVDGLDGWQMLLAQTFDLVITDVDMPRMDGIELVRTIKQDPRHRATPVMIVSYRESEEDRLRGLQAGADHYLAKSNFHDESLLAAVHELLGAAGD